MPFAVQIPDGWYAVRNPNYPQDNLFAEDVRRATISEALGVDALFSPLAEDGRLKCRYVLFSEAQWNGPDQCDSWVREHRDALKWQVPGGTPRVLTREKTVEAAVLKEFGPQPSERDLSRINAYALEPLTAEGVYVRRMHLCNTQVDRSFERFTERNLRQIAKSIVGKSVMLGHEYHGTPQGRFFDASVEKAEGVAHATPEFWLVRAAPSAAEAIAQIDGGVWKDVSVGFNYEAMQCDLCLGDYLDYNACRHIAGETYPADELAKGGRGGFEVLRDGDSVIATVNYGTGQVEGLEGSFVWLGCQYDAEVVKAHRKLYGDAHEAKRAEAEQRGWVPGRKTFSLPESPVENKVIPPVENLPRDRDSAWSWDWASDADAIINGPGWPALGRVCLFVEKDGSDWPEVKGKYHFPHGKLKGGTLTTYFRGCSAALQRLRGNPGSVPDTEAAERHLAAHYKQFDEEFPTRADGAPAAQRKEQRMDDSPDIETQLTETKTALAESTQAAEEAKASLAALEDRVKAVETERDEAQTAAKVLRDKAEGEVAWYAQQLKLDDVLAALAGESGLAGLSAEKLLELRESWREKYEATLPPRMQSKHEIGTPEADPDSKTDEPQPITDPRARRAARM